MTIIDGIYDAAGDLRRAARMLVKSPTFAVASVLVLAIGLTGTVSMFTLINGVLLSPLPVRAEQELYVGWRGRPEAGARRWPFTSADLDLLRREARHFSGVAGVGYTDPWPWLFVDGDRSFVVRAARVTGDFFHVLGAEPLYGRLLRADDDRTGAENVLVVSHGLWQSRFGAAHDIIGRRVALAGQSFTIVGVMPRDVDHPRHVEAWMTLAAMQATTTSPAAREAMASELYLFARLRTGSSAIVAGEELRALTPTLDALRSAGDNDGFVPQLQSFRDAVIGDVRTALVVLFGAVGFVLLVACANVASLFLIRADARRGEFAVRAALGAGPVGLLRQVLVEGFLLAAVAGLLAVAATSVLLPLLLASVPNGLPRVDIVRVDASVIAVSAILTCGTAILATMLSALSSGRTRLMAHLKDAGRDAAIGSQRNVRRAIVAGQVALAVAGLIGVGLLVSSLQRLRHEATLLAAENLVIAPLVMPQVKYEDRAKWRRFITMLVDTIASDPRVAAATPVNATPFAGTGWEVPVMTAEGQSDEEARANPSLSLEEVDPSYFRTFEVTIVRGRPFTSADRQGTPRVAIVTADVAQRVWPGEDPIGKRLKWGTAGSDAGWMTVVGIAAPTGYRDLRSPWPTLYVPAAQMLGAADQIVIRTAMPTAQLAELVKSRVGELDSDVEIMPLRPFEELLEEPLAGPRFYALLMTAFGMTGVALAGVGLYGVIAASVRQRRREIGIRLALGAEGYQVRRLIAADGVVLVTAGVALGLATSLLTTRAMRGLLYGVEQLDPTVLAGAVAATVCVAGLAFVAPLRAASRVEPAEVLRTE